VADVVLVLVHYPPGAIGFDRMATVVVACRGRSLGLVKHVSKSQLPTAMLQAESALPPRFVWLPK
jgi:hypothetical protein